jgi:hypothetical protein
MRSLRQWPCRTCGNTRSGFFWILQSRQLIVNHFHPTRAVPARGILGRKRRRRFSPAARGSLYACISPRSMRPADRTGGGGSRSAAQLIGWAQAIRRCRLGRPAAVRDRAPRSRTDSDCVPSGYHWRHGGLRKILECPPHLTAGRQRPLGSASSLSLVAHGSTPSFQSALPSAYGVAFPIRRTLKLMRDLP